MAVVEFGDRVRGIAEESWAKLGGMDDKVELYGSGGVIFADLLRGNALHTYSESGYDYAVEKAGSTRGWSGARCRPCWPPRGRPPRAPPR